MLAALDAAAAAAAAAAVCSPPAASNAASGIEGRAGVVEALTSSRS
jgi:hypothetical protein